MIEKPEQGVASNEARATAVEPVPVSSLRGGIANARPPLNYSLGCAPDSYGTMVWYGRVENLRSHIKLILDYLPEEADYLRSQVQAAMAEASRYLMDYAPQRFEPIRHAYVPHRKYPWFCGECGYPPHEELKHLPAQAIETRRAETQSGSVHESAVHAPEKE